MVDPSPDDVDADQVRAFFFELSPDPILVFRQGLVTHANPAAVELLRAGSLECLVGMHSKELLHPTSHATVESNVRAIEAGAKVTRSEETYIRLDGTPIEVEVSAARATFYDGRAFVVILRDMTDRREIVLRREREQAALRASEAARAREQWLRGIFDFVPVAIFARDESGRFVLVNEGCAALVGRRPAAMLGRTAADVDAARLPFFAADDDVWRTVESGSIAPTEQQWEDAEGVLHFVQTAKVRATFEGRPVVLGVVTDLTEQKALQSQLLHAQKMESLGRLAGGIAHDFNNLLTVIIECTDHLAEVIPAHLGDLTNIREASSRAASLTSRLLAFARQAPGQLRTLVLDDVLPPTVRLLGRVLGEDVVITTSYGAPGACVRIELEQFELALINLAVNARDAMPLGGTLAIVTTIVETPSKGRRLQLDVRDSGIGMDEATQRRAVEPFFTTKREGVGTGLGLSTCLGIIEQCGGELVLDSELGRGTTVRILLPIRAPEAAPLATAPTTRTPSERPRAGTVLMVEDDALVRRATNRMLRSLGFSVLTAAGPNEALALAREHPGPIDVLLTDVVMPGMNGAQLARAFSELRPTAAVVFVSGHARDAFDDAPAELQNYLSKPFSRDELSDKLGEVMAAAPRA